MAEITSLPEELLISIFQYLPFHFLQSKVILVSKKWYKTIRYSSKLSSKIKSISWYGKFEESYPVTMTDNFTKNWPVLKTIHIENKQYLLKVASVPQIENIILKIDEHGEPAVFGCDEKIEITAKSIQLNLKEPLGPALNILLNRDSDGYPE